jgi:hypothetical protein
MKCAYINSILVAANLIIRLLNLKEFRRRNLLEQTEDAVDGLESTL